MAICCECSPGEQYIIQQYVSCCDPCLCEPRTGCFYIEAATSTNPNYQTGIFSCTGVPPLPDTCSPQWAKESGCYYSGSTQNWSINIFPPFFSGSYESAAGSEGFYVNDSSGSGAFWQIYNVTNGYSYDRGPTPQYAGCEGKFYHYKLEGTGWTSASDSTYTFSIGNCCMTGDCIQQAPHRCYYFETTVGRYTTFTTTTWGWTSTKPITIYDSGNIRLDPDDCAWMGYGEGSTSAQLSYYDGGDGAQWHVWVDDDVGNVYELFSIDGSDPPNPAPQYSCSADLAGTTWTSDPDSASPPWDGAWVTLGDCNDGQIPP